MKSAMSRLHLIDKPVAEVQRILALNEHILLDAPLRSIPPHHRRCDCRRKWHRSGGLAGVERTGRPARHVGGAVAGQAARAVIERRYGLNGADTCTLK